MFWFILALNPSLLLEKQNSSRWEVACIPANSSLQRCHLRITFAAASSLSQPERKRINKYTVAAICWSPQIVREWFLSVAVGRQESRERWRYHFSRAVKRSSPQGSTCTPDPVALCSVTHSSLHLVIAPMLCPFILLCALRQEWKWCRGCNSTCSSSLLAHQILYKE